MTVNPDFDERFIIIAPHQNYRPFPQWKFQVGKPALEAQRRP